jgi:hypothetical protein
VIKTETAQHTEHGISSAVAHVEQDCVAVRLTRGSLEHDQVLDAGQACERAAAR